MSLLFAAVALLLGVLHTCVLRAGAHNSVLLLDLLAVLPPPGAMSLCELLLHPVALLGAQRCEQQERSSLVCSRSFSSWTGLQFGSNNPKVLPIITNDCDFRAKMSFAL